MIRTGCDLYIHKVRLECSKKTDRIKSYYKKIKYKQINKKIEIKKVKTKCELKALNSPKDTTEKNFQRRGFAFRVLSFAFSSQTASFHGR